MYDDEVNELKAYNQTINSYMENGYTLEETIRLAEQEETLDSQDKEK